MTEDMPRWPSRSLSQQDRDRREELLTPAAVAAMHRCSKSAVHVAITKGELQAEAVLGPDGEPSTYGVRRWVAEAWAPRTIGRPPGRPHKSTAAPRPLPRPTRRTAKRA